MAVQQQTSILASKLGERLVNAHNKAKDKPPEVGSGELPSGIENGVAKLDECYIGLYKDGKQQGQPFFRATGVILEPKIFNGISVAGRKTTLGPIPLCDTPDRKNKKTFEEHYDEFLNELKNLGFDTAKTEGKTAQQTDALLQMAMAELVKQKVTFTFRTWKGKPNAEYPNPRLNEEWLGRCEYDPTKIAQGQANGMVDHGPSPLAPEPMPSSAAPVQPVQPAAATPEPVAPATPVQPQGELTLETATELANADPVGNTPEGKTAIKLLTDTALGLGVAKTVIEEAPDWTTVYQAITEISGGGDEDNATPDPVTGAVYNYRKPGKGGTPGEPVKIEIISVDPDKRTVTAKTQADGKPIAANKKPVSISWDALEAA